MTLLNKQRELLQSSHKRRSKKEQRKIKQQSKEEEKKTKFSSFETLKKLSPEEQEKLDQKREFRRKYNELWEQRKNKIMLRPVKYKPKQSLAKDSQQKIIKKKPNEVERSIEVDIKREKVLKKIKNTIVPFRFKELESNDKKKKRKRTEESLLDSNLTLSQRLANTSKVKSSVMSSILSSLKK